MEQFCKQTVRRRIQNKYEKEPHNDNSCRDIDVNKWIGGISLGIS